MQRISIALAIQQALENWQHQQAFTMLKGIKRFKVAKDSVETLRDIRQARVDYCNDATLVIPTATENYVYNQAC